MTDIRALQIDHINGGGTKEIRKITYTGIYRKILKNRDGYQLLCANCNWIKRYVNNECKPNFKIPLEHKIKKLKWQSHL